MQKNLQEKESLISENLSLFKRNELKLEGIVEIIATSDTNLILKLKDCPLFITGSNINITKIDVNDGILEATGNFESFKYNKSGNFFKRIFK